MKVYRLRLKGTELFYQPIKGRWAEDKSNLGESGKVYIARKPRPEDIGAYVNVSVSLAKKHNLKTAQIGSWTKGLKLAPEYEFEIVEYDCVEVNK